MSYSDYILISFVRAEFQPCTYKKRFGKNANLYVKKSRRAIRNQKIMYLVPETPIQCKLFDPTQIARYHELD